MKNREVRREGVRLDLNLGNIISCCSMIAMTICAHMWNAWQLQKTPDSKNAYPVAHLLNLPNVHREEYIFFVV